MKATFEDFKIIFNSFQASENEINSVPMPYQDIFFNNTVYNELHKALIKSIELAFSIDIAEWLFWYIFDKPKGPSKVSIKNNVYVIDTIDEFLFMIEEEYFNE
jgi:hypothetical protein